MFYIILSVHLVLCIFLIGIVLLQQGKGADAGALIGGGANSLLGVSVAGDFVTRLTTGIAIGFIITSILLVKYYDLATPIPTGKFDPLKGSVVEEAAKAAKTEAVTKVEKVEKVPAPK